jgi:Peptidase family M28
LYENEANFLSPSIIGVLIMRKGSFFFLVLLLSLTLSLGSEADALANYLFQENQTNTISPQPMVQEMIDQVSQTRILANLRRFTGVDSLCLAQDCKVISSRFTGSSDLQRVKSYVYQDLTSMHYTVEVLPWTRNGYSDQNILAHKPGMLYPNEEIYFIAHLDGVPNPGPAADDDGSGSVALLELAHILSSRYLQRSITLFFSTGEEEGSLGSHYFVEHYPERLGKIKYLVNLDMLSFDSNNDGVMELFNGSQPINFVQLLMDIINAYPINLSPQIYSDCG